VCVIEELLARGSVRYDLISGLAKAEPATKPL
jgi:hypothetical protein